MSDILLAEYTLKRALNEHKTELITTSNPHLLCTPLPKHWRSNKSLPYQFRVVSLIPIPDGTQVIITAGNEDRPCAELKNPITLMHGHEARFSDLRFLGRSGRGKSFNITITVETTPPLVALYARAIKVTVDGPRVPRSKYATVRTMRMHKDVKRIASRHGISYHDYSISAGRNYSDRCRRLNETQNDVNKFKKHPRMNSSTEMTKTFPNRFNQCNLEENCLKLNVSPLEMENRQVKNLLKPIKLMQFGQPNETLSSSPNENSLNSLGSFTYIGQNFTPFESTYLLSSINEAYAQLLVKQAWIDKTNQLYQKEKSGFNSNLVSESMSPIDCTKECPINSRRSPLGKFFPLKNDSNAFVNSQFQDSQIHLNPQDMNAKSIRQPICSLRPFRNTPCTDTLNVFTDNTMHISIKNVNSLKDVQHNVVHDSLYSPVKVSAVASHLPRSRQFGVGIPAPIHFTPNSLTQPNWTDPNFQNLLTLLLSTMLACSSSTNPNLTSDHLLMNTKNCELSSYGFNQTNHPFLDNKTINDTQSPTNHINIPNKLSGNVLSIERLLGETKVNNGNEIKLLDNIEQSYKCSNNNTNNVNNTINGYDLINGTPMRPDQLFLQSILFKHLNERKIFRV